MSEWSRLCATLEHWVNLNSGSFHPQGLARMADALQEHLALLPGEGERVSLPEQRLPDGTMFRPGDLLRRRFHPEAPVQVLFSGHMDTVYGPESPFQRLETLPDGRLRGPGVADMKGGLLIMLEAVRRFAETPEATFLGGEILITADEEIGSPASRPHIEEAAGRHHLGLVFESALPGGELVCQRKGTGLYRLSAKGRAAHTGRDFESGRNAAVAIADLVLEFHGLNESLPEAILNLTGLASPGPVNVVPADASALLNIRLGPGVTPDEVEAELRRKRDEVGGRRPGIELTIEGGINRPPREESAADARLHAYWNAAEKRRGLPLSGKRATGGSSDGNLLAAKGLPHLDGVGIRGGAIHSEEEFALAEGLPGQIEQTVEFLRLLGREHTTLATTLGSL